jgi:hypothetical protein
MNAGDSEYCLLSSDSKVNFIQNNREKPEELKIHTGNSSENVDNDSNKISFDLEEIKNSNFTDNKLYEFLIEKIYLKDDLDKFYSFFYSNKNIMDSNYLKASEFTSVGVFEDLSYLLWWTEINDIINSVEILKKDFDLFYWRKIKGDGNCFYRAVLINYIELLLIYSQEKKNPNLFFLFIKDVLFTSFPKDKERFKMLSILVFLIMYKELVNSCVDKSFDILYKAYNKSDVVEKTLIFWLKLKLSEFLKSNLELDFNGLKLVQLIPGLDLEDDMTYNKNAVYKYIDEDLAKMNEFVEGYPLYITPLILKLKINIFHLDSSFKPILFPFGDDQNLSQKISPTLNFLPDLSSYNDEINIFFRSLHYDTFYKSKLIDKLLELYTNAECIIIQGQMDQIEYKEYKSNLISQAKKTKLLNNPITRILESDSQNKNPAEMTNIIIDLNNVNLESNEKRVIFRGDKKDSETKRKIEIKKLMKHCKACGTKTKFIQLSDKCEVCFDCQKRAVTKSNKLKDPNILKKYCVDKCISCKKNIRPQDYDIILN